MALLGHGGGLMDPPVVEGVGYEDWAQMTSMSPGHPLVGGQTPGFDVGTRQVAIGAPDPTAGAAAGSPMSAHWSEVFNLRGNPIGWVLVLAVLYLGLMHLHVNGSAGFGVGRRR